MNSRGSWLLTACHEQSRRWLAVGLAVASRLGGSPVTTVTRMVSSRWLMVKAAVQLQCQSVEAQSGCQGAVISDLLPR